MIIAGIDPSTKAGVSIIELPEDGEGSVSILAAKEIFSRKKKFPRSQEVARRISHTLQEYSPVSAFIEGYVSTSYGTNINATEVAVLSRDWLHRLRIPYLEVPPTTLKKFVADHGKADKALMIKSVRDTWGFSTKSDNVADAVGLAFFGAAYFGQVLQTPSQAKVVEVFRSKNLFC